MSYEAYYYHNDDYREETVILGWPFSICSWDFDSPKSEIDPENPFCHNLEQLKLGMDLIKELFNPFIKIQVYCTPVDGFNKTYIKHNATIENLEALLQKTDHVYNVIIIIHGNCVIEKGRTINAKLFEISLFWDSVYSTVSFNTNNVVFLPNNIITGLQHYEVWKENAVRLAKVLRYFDKHTSLELDPYDFDKLSSPVEESPYFRANSSIRNQIGDYDEFHVPFELLEKEDFELFFGEQAD